MIKIKNFLPTKFDDIENQIYLINDDLIDFNKKKVTISLNSNKLNKIKKSKSYPNEIFLSEIKYKQNKLLEIELPNIKNNNLKFFSESNESNTNESNTNESNESNESNELNESNESNELNESNEFENLTNPNYLFIKNKTYFEYFYNKINQFLYKITFKINKINKINMLNKFISIFLHVFIMVVFEIYFYFNYIVIIEKNEFLNKIDDYIKQIESNIFLSPEQKHIIKTMFDENSNNQLLNYLYKQYIQSINSQKKLLYHLLIKACGMAGIIGSILSILLIFGIFNKNKIKWNWILIENLIMFILLGIFEYLFFTNIIMHYNPITNDEVKYRALHDIYSYLNSSSTN